MKIHQIVLSSLSVLLMLVLTSSVSMAQVNGQNATLVQYEARASSNSPAGYFVQMRGKDWVEFVAGKKHATFKETKRDAWSVYLRKSDGLQVQLDLHTKKAILAGGKYGHYKINGSSAKKATGQSVEYVKYYPKGGSGGVFVVTSTGNWAEYKTGKRTKHATFKELRRDMWSVYLQKSDGMKIQLDLHTKKITLNVDPYYTIQDATNSRKSFTLPRRVSTNINLNPTTKPTTKPRPKSATSAVSFDQKYYYRLTTKWQGEGKSLDVINGGKKNKLQLAKTGPYTGQFWKITPIGNTGYFRLTTQFQGTGKSLDVVNDGKNNKLQLAKTGGYTGQMWIIEPIGKSGYYRLTTKWQGKNKSLDVVNDGKNNKLQLAKTGMYTGQMWKLTKTPYKVKK